VTIKKNPVTINNVAGNRWLAKCSGGWMDVKAVWWIQKLLQKWLFLFRVLN
jgi:hypothetical protein